MHPCNNFGMWTVNKMSEECVTLHSDLLEMSYELNIKMKSVAPLLLGDVKNLLTPLVLYQLYHGSVGTYLFILITCFLTVICLISNLGIKPQSTIMMR